jgi:hypothetical protein
MIAPLVRWRLLGSPAWSRADRRLGCLAGPDQFGHQQTQKASSTVFPSRSMLATFTWVVTPSVHCMLTGRRMTVDIQ